MNECLWCVEQAIALESVPEASPTAGASGLLGECLRTLGRFDEARAACVAGIDAAERSDHMYRDTFRAISLCSLGRTALGQRDVAAAHAAFSQAIAQLKGRERTLGGGFLLVQALAGLSRAGGGAQPLEEARQLYQHRDRFNFSILWTCDDPTTDRDLQEASLEATGAPESLSRRPI